MSPEQVKDCYRRLMDERGETVAVRRYTGAGANRPWFEAECMAVVTAYESRELVGTIQQGDRKVILLVEDLLAAQFALPLRPGDKVRVRGRELNIEAPDDNTRRVQGVHIAYELQVRG